MQTGKILGIGAALSAGLLAAHVASASTALTLEEYSGTSTFATATLSGSAGSYSASSGSYNGVSWSSVLATVVNSGGTASLQLAFTGLKGTPGSIADFLVSDTAFSETGTNLTLSASYSQTITSGSGSGDIFGVVGFADSKNAAFGVPSGDAGGYPSGSVVSDTPGASSVSAGSLPTVSLASNYSLTTNAQIQFFSGNTYSATFKTSVTGAAPAAVSLPGSGPLTIIGGLVMVGGLAIRRRIKV